MKLTWAYQKDDTGCNTTILITLINQENLKSKKQWRNWVGEVCSVNRSDRSYLLFSYWFMQSILSIVSIILVLAFSIAVHCNWSIVKMTQQTLVWTFGVKNGNFSRLLAFTGICKYFTRSVWEINKTLLGVLTSNYPQGKSFTLRDRWGCNIFPR